MNLPRAGIALGSNLGPRMQMLKNARDRIRAITGVRPPIVQSAVYETSPVNCEPDARGFYNAVVEIGFEGPAEALFQQLRQIETDLGRMRSPGEGRITGRSHSRTIDLDLLYFDDERIDRAELQLPHPRMTARRFVLQPLADINPDLQLAGQPATVRELLARLPPSESVQRVAEKW